MPHAACQARGCTARHLYDRREHISPEQMRLHALADGHVILFVNCYLVPGSLSVPPASAIVEIDPGSSAIMEVYDHNSDEDRFFSFVISLIYSIREQAGK